MVGDDYTALKKEQKNLSSLYNTAHAYISRSPSGIHDSFVDKVLITGLEKSELDTKAPLATQEEDFLQVVDDSTDSAAKKQQQIEAMNANNVKNRLNKVRRSLYTLVKQASKSLITNAHEKFLIFRKCVAQQDQHSKSDSLASICHSLTTDSTTDRPNYSLSYASNCRQQFDLERLYTNLVVQSLCKTKCPRFSQSNCFPSNC